MAYISQLEALLVSAEGYLASARREAENWPLCGIYLARALEFGACAVFMAWGDPYKPGKKVHPHFEERLAPLLDPGIPPVVQGIWEYEGQGRPNDTDQMLAVCEYIIQYFDYLAKNAPPASWQSLPVPQSIGWGGLSAEEQTFLQTALEAARQVLPSVRVLLFGSRAAGNGRPDSDYDLLFIFPDAVSEVGYGYVVSEVVSFADSNGVEIDVERTREADWLNPPEVSRPLFDRIKACFIEIPDP
jgi:predicted nucleotidyltransferase